MIISKTILRKCKAYGRRVLSACAVLLICVSLISCGVGEEGSQYEVVDSDFVLYDLNSDKTALVKEAYYPSDEDYLIMIDEMLTLLSDGTSLEGMSRPLPQDVSVQDFAFDSASGKLTVSFSRSYGNLEGTLEPLVRACFVKTLMQVEEVKSIEFEVDHVALTSASGTTVGPMNDTTFVMSMTGDGVGISEQVTTLTLYYPDATGERLIKEQRKVSYNSNTPVARVVMNCLKEQPETEGAKSAYGSGTSVLSISTADGVCYVNFDSTFLGGSTDVSETASVYAVVNSLTELSGVNKVFLSVDGDILAITGKADAGILYVRNDSIVISDDNEEAEEEKSEDTSEDEEEDESEETESSSSAGVSNVISDMSTETVEE